MASPLAEPMVLGSPGSASNSFLASSSNQHSFLGRNQETRNNSQQQAAAPAFLLGGSRAQATPSRSAPQKLQQPSPHVTWSPDLVQRYPQSDPVKAKKTPAKTLSGGPPLHSLTSELASKTPGEAGLSNPRQDSFLLQSEVSPKLGAAQVDPFYTQGEQFVPEEDLDPTWVTVFGFPPDSATFILQKFSEYGTILHHEFKGNWVHVHYQSSVQARRALAKNARVFGANLQVGVTPCIDKTVIGRYRNSDSLLTTPEANSQSSSLSSFGVPSRPGGWVTSTPAVRPLVPLSTPSGVSSLLNTGNPSLSTVGASDSLNVSSPARPGMRSLTAAFHTPNRTDGPPVSANDSGVMNRAWNYVFGS